MRQDSPLADANDVEHVRRICREGKAYVRRGLTERYLAGVWQVSQTRLGEAVAEHIELKRKVFAKLDVDGKCLQGRMHANVELIEDLHIYVEMQLIDDRVVILGAHGHTPGFRLPQ